MAEALRVTQVYLDTPPYFEALRVTQAYLDVPPVPTNEGLRITQVVLEAPITAPRGVVLAPTGTALAQGYAPAISYGVGISGGGPMAAASLGLAPVIDPGRIVTIAGDATAQGLPPQVSGTGGSNEALRVTQVLLDMPSFAAKVLAVPGTALAQGYAPAISYGVGVSGGGPMAASATAFAPTVVPGVQVVPVGTAGAAGLAPQFAGGARVIVPPGVSGASGLAPNFVGGGTAGSGHVTVPVGTADAAGIPPSLIITTSGNTPTAGDKQVTITGPGFTVTVVED